MPGGDENAVDGGVGNEVFGIELNCSKPNLRATWLALGAVAVATDGTVRDLEEVRALGFQFFAKEVSASHAYVHLVEIGIPITVGGLAVNMGDLLHGDKHGVTSIPLDIADRIPAMVQTIADYEQQTIGLCQSPDFSLEKLKEIAKITRPY